jgi:hypothetical protein
VAEDADIDPVEFERVIHHRYPPPCISFTVFAGNFRFGMPGLPDVA